MIFGSFIFPWHNVENPGSTETWIDIKNKNGNFLMSTGISLKDQFITNISYLKVLNLSNKFEICNY